MLYHLPLVSAGLLLQFEPLQAQSSSIAPPDTSWEDAPLVAEIAETIIPQSDTPGAKAAQVEQYILLMLKDCLSPQQRSAFFDGLRDFEQRFQQEQGLSFLAASPAQRHAFVASDDRQKKPFLSQIKALTMASYFSSKIGMTQALSYLPVPGKWEACRPIQAGEKAWASYF